MSEDIAKGINPEPTEKDKQNQQTINQLIGFASVFNETLQPGVPFEVIFPASSLALRPKPTSKIIIIKALKTVEVTAVKKTENR